MRGYSKIPDTNVTAATTPLASHLNAVRFMLDFRLLTRLGRCWKQRPTSRSHGVPSLVGKLHLPIKPHYQYSNTRWSDGDRACSENFAAYPARLHKFRRPRIQSV